MDIYRITNKDTGESILIGSKEYIDLKFKVLKDTLVNYIKNKNPSEDVNFSILDNESVVDISEVLENSNSIRAQNVIEDDQHSHNRQSCTRMIQQVRQHEYHADRKPTQENRNA